MSNVPDDWGMYYTTCEFCGSRYHASEGGCGCCDECEICGEIHSLDELEDNGMVCNECLACDHCGEITLDNHRFFVIDREKEDFDPENPPMKKKGRYPYQSKMVPECEVLCPDCIETAKTNDYSCYTLIRVDEDF